MLYIFRYVQPGWGIVHFGWSDKIFPPHLGFASSHFLELLRSLMRGNWMIYKHKYNHHLVCCLCMNQCEVCEWLLDLLSGIGLNVLYCRLKAVEGDFGFQSVKMWWEFMRQEGLREPFEIYFHTKMVISQQALIAACYWSGFFVRFKLFGLKLMTVIICAKFLAKKTPRDRM